MFKLYIDGGGTPSVPTYFSYKLFKGVNFVDKNVLMNRFYLSNLSPELLPECCSIYDHKGESTNNIAEYASLYYALKRFKEYYDYENIKIFHDSQLVVNQVNGVYQCKSDHLQPWLSAILKLWWSDIDYKWVSREVIVKILGH